MLKLQKQDSTASQNSNHRGIEDSALLRDTASERTMLGTIIKHGKNALVDVQDSVTSTDFSLPINRAIFTCLENLAEDPNCEVFDLESVKMKAKTLGFGDFLQSSKDLEYIELLDSVYADKDNLNMFALQIKKYSVARDLYKRYSDAQQYLRNIDGTEDLAEIIQKAESQIVDYVTGIEGANCLENLCENLEEYIEEAVAAEPVDQVGLPTGFPTWDAAIGGGPRPATITVVGARPKTGKSFHAMNVSLNLVRNGIPVLYLDTELTGGYQKDRMICIDSGCPLLSFETRQFNKNAALIEKVRNSGKLLQGLPFEYQNIGGMSHTEALALARRWIVKNIGFNANGQANHCAIIYDYMKLTTASTLTKVTPEYIVLGLMLTEMHNFAMKYGVPIIGYVQLNREGIDNDDGSVIAGSDRILWLCSSMSLLRNKNQNDVDLNCGFEHGNKKISILETRQGPGLEEEMDYINLKASLKPKIGPLQATGLMTEGLRFCELAGLNVNNGIPNQQ
jgi:replicative DNA helicase